MRSVPLVLLERFLRPESTLPLLRLLLKAKLLPLWKSKRRLSGYSVLAALSESLRRPSRNPMSGWSPHQVPALYSSSGTLLISLSNAILTDNRLIASASSVWRIMIRRISSYKAWSTDLGIIDSYFLGNSLQRKWLRERHSGSDGKTSKYVLSSRMINFLSGFSWPR